MSTNVRIGFVLALTVLVGLAYSPASFADKKNNNSNSSNSDDKKDKDKDKDNQNDQRRSRGNKNQNDDQNSNSQKFQKSGQGDKNKQGGQNNNDNNSNKSQPIIIGNGPQNNQSQKFQQGQNFQNLQKQSQFQNLQKQNSSQQKDQKNIQLQGAQNKPDWIEKSHKDHKDVKNFVVKFGGPEPFSNKWYKDHPKAWHHHHDNDDAWKIVTAAGLVGFLGWEAYHPRTVVVYQPVPYDTLFVSRPGVIIDPSRGDWAPLGRFSLMLGPGDNSTRMLDLAVDRFGHIRGSYYDMISDASYNVAGIIDQRSQYAQWSLESNRGLTFYTPLGEMMQPQGLVYVQLPSGERQQWQIVRMEDAGY